MSNNNRARLFVVFFMLVGLVNSTIACEARSGNAAPPTSVSQDPAPVTPKPEQKPEAKAEKVPCTLPREQASDINGLRLGLTTEQVLALFPGAKEDPDLKPALAKPPTQYGTSTLMIKPEKYASKEKFAGIREVIFSFFDGRVSSFQANYESAPWKHVDEFVTSFTTGSKLPGVDSWEAYSGLDTQQKSLKCNGFEVTLFAGGEAVNVNHVKVQDLIAAEEYKERRAKAKQKAAAAKPN